MRVQAYVAMIRVIGIAAVAIITVIVSNVGKNSRKIKRLMVVC